MWNLIKSTRMDEGKPEKLKFGALEASQCDRDGAIGLCEQPIVHWRGNVINLHKRCLAHPIR